MPENNDNQANSADVATGCAVIGSLIAGCVALVAAVWPYAQRDFLAAAGMILAAGLTFSLLANALIRR